MIGTPNALVDPTMPLCDDPNVSYALNSLNIPWYHGALGSAHVPRGQYTYALIVTGLATVAGITIIHSLIITLVPLVASL